MDVEVVRDLIRQARAQRRDVLDEPEGKAVLKAFGLRVPSARIVCSDDEVRAAFATLHAPLALKVVGVVHKSEVGGVRLNLAHAGEACEAMRAMKSALVARGIDARAWLLEEMARSGLEMVVGGVVDADFGPMIMTGLGGVFVEVLNDVAYRICPIDADDAREMLGQLRGAALLHGVRGTTPPSLEAIVDALLRIGAADGLLMRLADELAEVDVNPLIVHADGACAVDARLILRR